MGLLRSTVVTSPAKIQAGVSAQVGGLGCSCSSSRYPHPSWPERPHTYPPQLVMLPIFQPTPFPPCCPIKLLPAPSGGSKLVQACYQCHGSPCCCKSHLQLKSMPILPRLVSMWLAKPLHHSQTPAPFWLLFELLCKWRVPTPKSSLLPGNSDLIKPQAWRFWKPFLICPLFFHTFAAI